MFDFSHRFGNAAVLLLVSAVLHLAVIAVSLGGYVVPMLAGAVLWIACAGLLGLGKSWIAGLVFLLAVFAAATVPLAYAMIETGLISAAFWGIVIADFGAALALFLTLWRGRVGPASAR